MIDKWRDVLSNRNINIDKDRTRTPEEVFIDIM